MLVIKQITKFHFQYDKNTCITVSTLDNLEERNQNLALTLYKCVIPAWPDVAVIARGNSYDPYLYFHFSVFQLQSGVC